MRQSTTEPTAPDRTQTHLVSDAVWHLVEPLIPPHPRRKQGGGRHRVDDRRMFSAMAYILLNDCHWRRLPAWFGVTVPTVHRRFQQWTDDRLWSTLKVCAADHVEDAPILATWLRTVADAATARAEEPAYRKARRGDRRAFL